MLLLLLPITYANYAVVPPNEIIVEKGFETEFELQVQAYTSNEDLVCDFSFDENPFEIKVLDSEVSKGSASMIKATIKAPRNIELGDYSYAFCVGCEPKTSAAGSTTKVRFCDISIDIKVIESEKKPFPLLAISIALVIIITISFFFYKRK